MSNSLYFKKVLYSEDFLQEATLNLANWINKKYKNSKNLVLIVTMLGAVPFSMDLIKNIEIIHELDFVGVKSYFGKKKQTDVIMIDKDISLDIKNKDVIILEDIVDSGRTLERIIDFLERREPKSLITVSLLKRQENNVEIKKLKYGIEVPPGLFLVGYGLDYNNKYRNLRDIGILKDKFMKED